MLVLDKYKILEEVGRGGMGLVYRAQDKKVGRVVAIKELIIPSNIQMNDKDVLIGRFKREAITSSSLSHPNIVTVFDFGEENDRHFIAMEFLKGDNLKDFFTKQDVSIEQLIHIFIQTAQGLEFAHSKNIIHRDIKPANIQILPGNIAKITDFGIAKIKDIESSFTQAGTMFGTLGYISPEQVTDSKNVDHRADIYSFGAMMYEVITGKVVFEGDNLGATVYKILMAKPQSLREIKTEIPENVEKIVLKCLEKDPAERYQSVEQIIGDLRKTVNDNTNNKIVFNSKKADLLNKTLKINNFENIEQTVKVVNENKYMEMTRGQNIFIKEYTNSEHFTIAVNWIYKNSPITVDLSAIMISEDEKLEKDENFIFYNNLISKCGSLRLDQSENNIYKSIIDIDLDNIPDDIAKIRILINTEEENLSKLKNIELSIISQAEKSLLYKIDDFHEQKTGVIADLYKYKGSWKIKATGEGYNADLEGFLRKYVSESVEIYKD